MLDRKLMSPRRRSHAARAQRRAPLVVRAAAGKEFDYDLVIIGCGVGGHGAALHAVESVRRPLSGSDAVCPQAEAYVCRRSCGGF